jgi:negative regulator of sigma E activity
MIVSEERLIAYADGELSGDEARAVEAELKSRPELRAFVEQQQALRRHIHSSLAPVLDEPVPDRLLSAVARAPVSPRWRLSRALSRTAQTAANRPFLLWSGLPAAAALACGLLAGIMIVPASVLDVRHDDGTIAAQGTLAMALEQNLASAQSATDPVRVGVSFRSKDGRYCRTFESAGAASSLSGVACRDAQGWTVAALAATAPEKNAGAYRMAGSAMPGIIRSTVAGMIAGEPFDAAAERRARDAGWR